MKTTLFFICFLFAVAAFGQNVTNTFTGQQTKTGDQRSNVASSASGGSCTPSYSDPTGVGITVTDQGGMLSGQGQSLPPVALATNDVSRTGLFFRNGLALNGSTFSLIFDFGSPTLITEDKYFQSDATAQGTWKWQGATSTNSWVPGSNDGSIWTDIGGTFSLATAATTTHTVMSGNTTKYRFYRALGISGTTSFTPWVFQFQFKLCQ